MSHTRHLLVSYVVIQLAQTPDSLPTSSAVEATAPQRQSASHTVQMQELQSQRSVLHRVAMFASQWPTPPRPLLTKTLTQCHLSMTTKRFEQMLN